jgi:hypothetical protein
MLSEFSPYTQLLLYLVDGKKLAFSKHSKTTSVNDMSDCLEWPKGAIIQMSENRLRFCPENRQGANSCVKKGWIAFSSDFARTPAGFRINRGVQQKQW